MNYKTRQPFPNAAYVEGQRNFTYFDRSLTSGLTDVVIESPGDFLYIDQASTGVVSVELNMRQGGTLAPILLAAGGSIECDFASIKLTASAQLNKTVRIVVGNGARIKSGGNVQATSSVISTVNGGRYRTLNNQSFLATGSCGAIAGEYAHIQLINPTGSGKTVEITSLGIGTKVTATMLVALGTYAAADLVRQGKSKYSAAVDSVSQIRSENDPTTLVGSNYIHSFTLSGVATKEIVYQEPIILTAGKSLSVVTLTANAEVVLNAEFNEE